MGHGLTFPSILVPFSWSFLQCCIQNWKYYSWCGLMGCQVEGNHHDPHPNRRNPAVNSAKEPMTLNDSCWALSAKPEVISTGAVVGSRLPQLLLEQLTLNQSDPRDPCSARFLAWIWHRAVLVSEKNAMITGRGRCWVRESHHHLDQYKVFTGFTKFYTLLASFRNLAMTVMFLFNFLFILAYSD